MMPIVELISPDKIPTSQTGRVSSALRTELTDALRQALHKNQGLILRLGQSERPARLSKILRDAAVELHVGVLISSGEPRTKVNACGRETTEPSILYVRITKAASNGSGRPQKPALDPLALRPIITAPAPFEKTALPGVEVSR